MKKLSAVLLIMLSAAMVYAQSGIKGSILDNTSSSPIEFASIAVYSIKDSSLVSGTISDANGRFELITKPGSYYVTAKFMGFETMTLSNVQVSKNRLTDLGTIGLKHDEKLLAEIEVTGEKLNTIHKVDRQVFEADQFQAAEGGTATDVLRNMPSVSIDGEGELSVRGTKGFVVLLNGKPVQSDPSMILDQLPANAVENVEIITAPSAKYDSEGKAGIINIITSKSATDGTYAQVNVKVGAPSIENYDNADPAYRYGADFTVHQQKGKWNWSLGGSYLRNDKTGRREGEVWTEVYDDINGTSGKRTDFPSDGERSFDEKNYSGRLAIGFQPTNRDEFNVSFYGGVKDKTRLADIHYFNNINSSIPEGEVIGSNQYYNHNSRNRTGDFALGALDYTHKFVNKSKISTSFLYEYTLLGGPTFNDNQTNDFSRSPLNSELIDRERNTNDNPLNGYRFNLDYQFKPGTYGTWEVGYQFRHLDHQGEFLYESQDLTSGIWNVVPAYTSDLNLERTLHSGYIQLSGKQGAWDYGAGVRAESMARTLEYKGFSEVDYTTLNRDYFRFFPSANLQYTVNEGLRIKGAYSKRVERTTTFKMNPFKEKEHSETLEQGYAELQPEFIDLVELGIVKDFGDANSFFANLYFRNTENLINRNNTVDSDTVLNRIYSNVGTGRAIGLELGSDLKLSNKWKLYAGGNVYHYTIDGTFRYRDRSISNAQEIIIPVNPDAWQYSFNINTTYSITETLSVNWSLNYLSERITAQGEDSRYYSPNLTVKKSFLDGRLTTSVQWLHMDAGLLDTNEQRISTWNYDGYEDPNTGTLNKFYTTTNYVYETDWVMFNISYNFTKFKNKAKFAKSEFGSKEF
ncbi:outer membrane beta-barrel family protein [Reichenbachiella versicolor]|uniref:outer membrane beta-barrel family protein n=1 Tax=Reichenbachiella versicolor TaxID=1821036 RepID=UPI000D6E4E11|nr:outer membrane beta-barrel family protein [Reichenbachiella versicolor]